MEVYRDAIRNIMIKEGGYNDSECSMDDQFGYIKLNKGDAYNPDKEI